MLLFTVIYFVNYLSREVSTVEFDNSDEDDELKDALILVNLLKSALRDGLDSSNGETTASLDMSTCATITETSPNSISTSPWSSKDFVNITGVYITTPTVPFPGSAHPEEYMRNYRRYPEEYRRSYRKYPKQYRRNYGFPFRRFFRRQMAPFDYNYYYDGHNNRRFDYEDAFGEHPNDTVPTKDKTSELSTKAHKSKTLITLVPKTLSDNVKSTLTVYKQVQNNKQLNFIQEPTVGARRNMKKQKLNFIDDHTTRKFEIITAVSENTSRKLQMNGHTNRVSIQITKDPVMSQVESELVKELKSEGVTARSNITKNKQNIFSFKKSYVKRGPARTRRYRPTLKIYLTKSTKIPIPFPENNAFCYTNPDNALCRTLI